MSGLIKEPDPKYWLLTIGGGIEFVALILLGYSSYLLGSAVGLGGFDYNNALHAAYNSATAGYYLAATGLAFLISGLVLRPLSERSGRPGFLGPHIKSRP